MARLKKRNFIRMIKVFLLFPFFFLKFLIRQKQEFINLRKQIDSLDAQKNQLDKAYKDLDNAYKDIDNRKNLHGQISIEESQSRGEKFALNIKTGKLKSSKKNYNKLGLDNQSTPEFDSDLFNYFKNHQSGPGIWKWLHYFNIYERHFQKFRDKEVNILEIGIYSGGSLEMWHHYFGDKCKVFGVDLEEECRVYEKENTKIFIGDQGSRPFWRDVKKEMPQLDILIDDGGHLPEQQMVTFEEMFSHINPGGVFLCEDIHWANNQFNMFTNGLVNHLNGEINGITGHYNEQGISGLNIKATPFQSEVMSICNYPFVTVIEKNYINLKEFRAPKHGTEWQPFKFD